jgi:hypothetical protein
MFCPFVSPAVALAHQRPHGALLRVLAALQALQDGTAILGEAHRQLSGARLPPS